MLRYIERKKVLCICLSMSPGCVVRSMVGKQTKSKFDRTTLFFSCDSMPGTIIINQQIHIYLHVPVLLLSQVPIVSSMIPYHPITTLLGSRSHQYISALAKMCLASRSVVSTYSIE